MRGRQSTCCFTGHRPAKLPWHWEEDDPRCTALKARIRDAVEAAIAEDMTHFICGMAAGCDLYFGEIVAELRVGYPGVTLEAAIPCLSQADGWPVDLRERYDRLLAACDDETLVQEQYSASCMQRRDRYMVDHAAMLIAVFDGQPGGTQYTMQYAMRRGLSIVDIPTVVG
ncbi:MAG: SLOG family protein, partial [Oscillospiraceae bacterium]